MCVPCFYHVSPFGSVFVFTMFFDAFTIDLIICVRFTTYFFMLHCSTVVQPTVCLFVIVQLNFFEPVQRILLFVTMVMYLNHC